MNISKNNKIHSDQKTISSQPKSLLIISSDLPVQSLYQILLKNPQLVNKIDNKGETLLTYSIKRKNTEICHLILSSTILDLSFQDKNGNSYLHLAVIKQLENVVKSLIDKGIYLNIQNNLGNTPLHLAYMYYNIAIINILVNNNIDVTIKNNDNKIAEELKNVKPLLKNSNSKVNSSNKKNKNNKITNEVINSCKFPAKNSNTGDKNKKKQIKINKSTVGIAKQKQKIISDQEEIKSNTRQKIETKKEKTEKENNINKIEKNKYKNNDEDNYDKMYDDNNDNYDNNDENNYDNNDDDNFDNEDNVNMISINKSLKKNKNIDDDEEDNVNLDTYNNNQQQNSKKIKNSGNINKINYVDIGNKSSDETKYKSGNYKEKISNNDEYQQKDTEAQNQIQIEDQEHDIFNLAESTNYKEKLANNRQLNNQVVAVKKITNSFIIPQESCDFRDNDEFLENNNELNENCYIEDVDEIQNDNEESEEENCEEENENNNNIENNKQQMSYTKNNVNTGVKIEKIYNNMDNKSTGNYKHKITTDLNSFYFPFHSSNISPIDNNNININEQYILGNYLAGNPLYSRKTFTTGYNIPDQNLFIKSQYNSLMNLNLQNMNNYNMINNNPNYTVNSNLNISNPSQISLLTNPIPMQIPINAFKKMTNKNKPLTEFLSQINMMKYYNIFVQSGFDDINLLIEQAKKGIFIKDNELREAGIVIPGDRAKILIKIQEKAGSFGFSVPKSVYYICQNVDDLENDFHINKLNQWLKNLKVEMYLGNFICCGYHTIELLLLQMESKNPLTNEILRDEVGVDKIGYRSRILNKLKDEGRSLNNKLKTSVLVLGEGENEKNCECQIY